MIIIFLRHLFDQHSERILARVAHITNITIITTDLFFNISSQSLLTLNQFLLDTLATHAFVTDPPRPLDEERPEA